MTYTVPTQFPNGFQGAITIKNNGTTATNSWRLVWTFADGQVIQNGFNGLFAQVGPNVTVDSLALERGHPARRIVHRDRLPGVVEQRDELDPICHLPDELTVARPLGRVALRGSRGRHASPGGLNAQGAPCR